MAPRPPATKANAPDSNGKNRNISRNALAIAYAAFGLLVAINLLGFVAFLHPALTGHADFRAYYSAGYLIRTGHRTQIYDYPEEQSVQSSLISNEQLALPFIHPAYEALLFVPFSLFGYRAAYLLFLALNVGLMYCTYRLLRQDSIRGTHDSNRFLPLLLGGFLPVSIALMQGQDSLLLLALLCAVQVALTAGSELAAGAILALGLFRFQIAIPIVCLYFVWRKWRVVGGFVVSAAAVTALSIGITGLGAARTYLELLRSVGSGADRFVPQVVSMMPNLRGLVETLAGGSLRHSTQLWLIAGLSLVAFFWCGLRTKGFATAVTLGVLVSYHALPHDLSLLIVPISFACARLVRGNSDYPRVDLAVVGLLVCAPTVLLFFGSSFYVLAIVLVATLVFRPNLFEFEPEMGRSATLAITS